jgi:hypothetical protein
VQLRWPIDPREGRDPNYGKYMLRLWRHKEFRVLRDMMFELEKGMTVDIAGPNGCGKINQHGPMHDHDFSPDVFSSNPFTIITSSAGSTGLDT